MVDDRHSLDARLVHAWGDVAWHHTADAGRCESDDLHRNACNATDRTACRGMRIMRWLVHLRMLRSCKTSQTVLVAWISSKNEASACIPALCQFIRSLRHCSTNYSTHATALYNRINTCIHKRLYDALVGGDSHDQALYLQCMLDVIVEGDSPTSSNVASMMPLHAGKLVIMHA